MNTKLYPKESSIQKAVLDYLALRKIYAFRVNTQGVPLHDGSGKYRPAPQKGVADILAILKPSGRWLAVECKRPGAKLTDDQEEFLCNIHENGGVTVVAKSLEDIELALRKLGY